MIRCDWCQETTDLPCLFMAEVLCPRCHTWALWLDNLSPEDQELELELMSNALDRVRRRVHAVATAGRHRS